MLRCRIAKTGGAATALARQPRRRPQCRKTGSRSADRRRSQWKRYKGGLERTIKSAVAATDDGFVATIFTSIAGLVLATDKQLAKHPEHATQVRQRVMLIG